MYAGENQCVFTIVMPIRYCTDDWRSTNYWFSIVWCPSSVDIVCLLIITAPAAMRGRFCESQFCPSVRLSVHPSVTSVHCGKTKWRTADILIPHEKAITLLYSWYQEWLVGDAPFRLKFANKMTRWRTAVLGSIFWNPTQPIILWTQANPTYAQTLTHY